MLAKISLCALLIANLVACNSEKFYQAGDWFTDRGNLALTASRNFAIDPPLEQRWQVTLPSGIRSSVVGAFGKLYVGADDNKLYALSPQDGSTLWTYDASGKISCTATAVAESKGDDKYVWIVDEEGALSAIDPEDGSELWSLEGGGSSFNSSTNYISGVVFHIYAELGSRLRAVQGSTGELLWEGPPKNVSVATPLSNGPKTVCIGLHQGQTWYEAYDTATGEIDWSILENQTGGFNISGVEGADGGLIQLYLPMYRTVPHGTFVRSVRPALDGTTLWETELPEFGDVQGMAVTRERDPNTLIVAQSTELSALDPADGTIRWQVTHETNEAEGSNRRVPQPVICGEYVYHVEGNTQLVARELASGVEVWSFTLDAPSQSSPMIGDETIYLPTTSGSVYAFSPAIQE